MRRQRNRKTSEGNHAAIGGIFLGFLGRHLSVYRKRIWKRCGSFYLIFEVPPHSSPISISAVAPSQTAGTGAATASCSRQRIGGADIESGTAAGIMIIYCNIAALL
jgi:hypothetical protein